MGPIFSIGLSRHTDSESLKDGFSGYGDVTKARVITDRDTGRSRGFGFVTFSTDESAISAFSAMIDGHVLDGRKIRVSPAIDRAWRPRGGGSSYHRGDGGYGGGSSGAN
ncbi:hypothetical protein Dimus_002211 [Dionaea muscipula]